MTLRDGCAWPRPWAYDEVVALLGGVLKFGMNPSLEAITELCEALGRPQDAFSVVQVTGTNGKTSTTRMTAALLHSEGLRTGLYTSPELERYPECMEVDGVVVSDQDFALGVGAALDTAMALWGPSDADGSVPAGITEFELLTAAALWLFRERGVDVAVLEVGLGGRWDATSVTSPAVAVVTGVGLDHTHILGDTLEKIAAEKAAIIKPASAPVLGPGTSGLEPIFLERAESVGAHARAVREAHDPTPVPEDLTVRYRVVERPSAPVDALIVDVMGAHGEYPALSLAGPGYQAPNIATAVAAAEASLGRALDPRRAALALAQLSIPGRFELLRREPPLLIDAAHNPQAAAVLADTIVSAWPDPARRPVVLLGVLADKDVRGIVSALAPVAGMIAVTQPVSDRALPAAELAGVVREATGEEPEVFASVAEALEALLGSSPEGLVVTGSITTAGQAKAAVRAL